MRRRHFLAASASLAGSMVPLFARGQTRPCPLPEFGVEGGDQTTTVCAQGDAEADWQARTSGPGVVWFHDFRSDDEVNNFRWSSAYGSGNDPLAKGGPPNTGYLPATYTRRITTDGITGGGCLEVFRPAGSKEGSDWWRPFSAMRGGTTTGNGRGAGNDDPAANGAVTLEDWTPTDGGDQTQHWGSSRGYYGSSQGGNGPWTYEGSEFWFQARVKMDPRRITGTPYQNVGKLYIFGRTDLSYVDQKIVVYSGQKVSGKNYFDMYNLSNSNAPMQQDAPGVSVQGDQPNTEWGTVGDGLCRLDDNGGRLANCWYYPDPAEWVTLMWHVVPGTSGGKDTLIEVYAARWGEVNFTRIWHQPNVDMRFDANHAQGYNAVHLSSYVNGLDYGSDFWIRHDQLILSREFIPCPQV